MTLLGRDEAPAVDVARIGLIEVAERVEALLAEGPLPRFVAIDGRSGSGKSSLAARLAGVLPSTAVVSTDDIAWWHSCFDWHDLLRTGIVEPLRQAGHVAYRPPPWDERDRAGAITVPAGTRLVLVEGVGSSYQPVRDLYDAVIWVQADLHERDGREADRIARGEVSAEISSMWLAEENPFMARHRGWERADIVVVTSGQPHDQVDEVVVARALAAPARSWANPPLVHELELMSDIALPGLVVLDVRWRLLGPPGAADYEAGHIPGAVFVDLDEELADPPGAHGRHPLPEASAFEKAMCRAGVCHDSIVVCYDDGDLAAASRLWWLLRYFGHRDVSVLDGGYAGWVGHGGQVSTAPAANRLGDFVAAPGGMPLVDSEQAAAIAATGVLVDVRTPERFRGDSEPVDPIAGHIPGAVNAPAAANISDDGRLASRPQLATRFAALGVVPGAPVAAYCGSGIAAAQTVLAMSVAGIDAALYADSWSGWITDPAHPIATGDRS